MCMIIVVSYFVFFFKQKTAYEMRISDWSSDVCSSDLARKGRGRNYHSVYFEVLGELGYVGLAIYLALLYAVWRTGSRTIALAGKIGRASCRERVCQYV